MADKNIRKETKKPKKTTGKSSGSSVSMSSIVAQPELITKKKKPL